MVVQFVLPFVVLLSLNSIIIHKIRNRFALAKKSTRDSNQGENKNSELQVFIILLLVTFAFLILSTPAYIFFIYVIVVDFTKTPYLFARYYLLYHVSHKLHISNYGVNFYLYVISGKKFRTDLRNLFPHFKKNKKNNDSSVTSIESLSTSAKI